VIAAGSDRRKQHVCLPERRPHLLGNADFGQAQPKHSNSRQSSSLRRKVEGLIVSRRDGAATKETIMPRKKTETTETPIETPVATEPTPEPVVTEPAPEPPKKKRKKAVPSGIATLADLAAAYATQMENDGKSNGTIASYSMELKLAQDELGAETPLADLTADRVATFFNSKRVTKLRSGKQKSQLSIDKTRRVRRLALVWAAERGIISKAPIPETEAGK
jgi:hypothetical protein